jgi:1-acyl-sn-glycerol-3-phosphate acyltransferase
MSSETNASGHPPLRCHDLWGPGCWRAWLQIAFFAVVLRPFMALFLGLRVRGREHLPAEDPFVLIANHTSHLDTASLLSLFPARRLHCIRPVAAADYFEKNRLRSWLTRALFHILPIARTRAEGAPDPRARMLEALAAGQSLILFPEGTRHSDGSVGRFRSGIAHLVQNAPDVPIVPAYLVNLGRSLPKGAFIPVPMFGEVRIGPALQPQGNKAEIVAALEAAVLSLREA